uniref:Uncharacterized protein n=1 Tax=Molossus molossus TaxID=27622 RepID=A0A7J8FAM8_MOLMO|nr:hypothetical protein HJG59_008562 [Molossus molossus]
MRAANGNAVYWQAARAVAAKKEVSWGYSDGGGLEPTAASAATSTSGTAAAAARSGAGVVAGVEKERVSRQCRNTSNSGREVAPPHLPPRPREQGWGLPRRWTGPSQAEPSEPGPESSSIWGFLQTQDREHPRPGHFVVAQAVSWL